VFLFCLGTRRVGDRRSKVQFDVRLADGDEAGGFLVFLQQTLLEQVVVHADNADLEIAEAAAQFRDAALEGEAEDQQPW